METLVLARVHSSAKPLRGKAIADALVRYAPPTLTETAWREEIERVAEPLRTLTGREVADRLGALAAHKRWTTLAGKVLPALGLGLAPDDKAVAKLGDAAHPWAAAIMARALGLWTEGAPPTLATACDAFAWRSLELPGKPKACPAEIRAVFVQRELGSDAGPPDRQVRLYAAKAVGAPRGEPRVLVDALVRLWCAGKQVGVLSFASQLRSVVTTTRTGVFGDRKVFIASVWDELRRSPAYATLSLDDFKTRLVAAHRAGDVALARADHVAAIDPELVAKSETTSDGASFHFIVREAS